jgi:cell division protein ZapA (FtsZ GTPase activity inhibitor)
MSDVSVKVEIAGGIYTLKIKSEDENNVKQAVELINQKISEFERNYGVKDKKDVMAMVTLMCLVKKKVVLNFKNVFRQVVTILLFTKPLLMAVR